MQEHVYVNALELGELIVSVGKTDTRINIVLGMLGAISSGASFLLVRLLLN